MFRFSFLLLLCLMAACSQPKPTDLNSVAAGNWLLLEMNPEAPMYDTSFNKIEDATNRTYTHKMIRLQKEGVFADVDSMQQQQGKWLVLNNQQLAIAKAGKGFDLFVASFMAYDAKNQVLKLRHKIGRGAGIDSLPVIWQFKKIDESNQWHYLFADSSNRWRVKPLEPEPVAVLQKRLSNMLLFYAAYFEMVSAESDFFVTWRFPLPFKFYAHGVGMKTLDKSNGFEQFFYDKADAEKAVQLIENAMRSNTSPYPKRDTYTLEYAALLKILARELLGH
jgi:hypothetical protein